MLAFKLTPAPPPQVPGRKAIALAFGDLWNKAYVIDSIHTALNAN